MFCYYVIYIIVSLVYIVVKNKKLFICFILYYIKVWEDTYDIIKYCKIRWCNKI
jgi:hypothetical protein